MGRHLVVVLAGALACAATIDADRRDYILAHPHGWVEVSIADDEILQVPETDSEGRFVRFARPDDCSIEIRIDASRMSTTPCIRPARSRRIR